MDTTLFAPHSHQGPSIMTDPTPDSSPTTVSRRTFLQASAVAPAVFDIVPRHVLGRGYIAPSDTLGGALIGCGGRGNGTFSDMCRGLTVKQLARCDVRFLGSADNKTTYTDF